VLNWKGYFRCWRAHGHLSSQPTTRSNDYPVARLQELHPVVAQFYDTYHEVQSAAAATSFRAITHRCRMVRLNTFYRAADGLVEDDPIGDGPAGLSQGQTRQARRKRYLFGLLYPLYDGLKDVTRAETLKSD
jgi:hypothetical protein